MQWIDNNKNIVFLHIKNTIFLLLIIFVNHGENMEYSFFKWDTNRFSRYWY